MSDMTARSRQQLSEATAINSDGRPRRRSRIFAELKAERINYASPGCAMDGRPTTPSQL